MAGPMVGGSGAGVDAGVNQRGIRDHNARLILSILHRERAVAGAELARRTGLSRPTVSTILRELEEAGLLRRGEPQRGRVGKPSVPMELVPEGVFSYGLKIGRRSAELLLLDFTGGVRDQLHLTYDYPLPEVVFGFLETGIARLGATLSEDARARICGIGIGTPFELWKWHNLTGPAAERFRSWKDVDFAREVAAFSDLPVTVVKDTTAACQAEHLFGRGRMLRDYAYFFIGAFIGGGVALNGTVLKGATGNAGALGSLGAAGGQGGRRQLVDTASLHLLATQLEDAGLDASRLWQRPPDWRGLEPALEPWLEQTASELAAACLSVCAVIDFEVVLIDGALPPAVRADLVARVRRQIGALDARGLILPRIEGGEVGANARAVGAACWPLLEQYLLNSHAGAAVAAAEGRG
ncbi:ROK family transcriptional regulator [Nocardioides marinus]|nr:ROK family transcriptional regulator [Nocardioides marinus]